MSWSIQAEGTKQGAARQLDDCKIYGHASPEEQAAFDKARAFLKECIANGYECSPESEGRKAVTIFKAAASGHGAQIGQVSLTYTIAWLS